MTTKPTTALNDFAVELDNYKGDNIWEDLIWGAVIPGIEIDEERCKNDGDGNAVFFKKNKEKLVYRESEKEWFVESDEPESEED